MSAVENGQILLLGHSSALFQNYASILFQQQTSVLSQQQTSVLSQQQSSVLSQQLTSILSQQQTSWISISFLLLKCWQWRSLCGRVRFELGSWSRLAKFLPTVAGEIGLGGALTQYYTSVFVSTADICPVSAADICPVSTADICPVSTEDIYPVNRRRDSCWPPAGCCDVFC